MKDNEHSYDSSADDLVMAKHIIYSYRAWSVIFSYLPCLDLIKFQAVCKFMYSTGVTRYQRRWRLEKLFTYLTASSDE